ncbi:MAG: hypothetical protein M1540_01400 [Candidatus Bathyarchaeota archaeon]|nr:hypothetical protein [Candidatus Bathyarchaeota archaeon]
MGNISKAFLLFVIMSVFSSLSIINQVSGQVGVTTPITPGFSVNYEEYNWYISPTYDVDPSTGKAVMTHEGYYKVNRYAHISISNQPFEPYPDSKGNLIDLFYDIKWKPHNADSWQTLLPPGSHLSQNKEFYLSAVSIGFKGNPDHSLWDLLDYIPGNQIDFQVQALIGYYTVDNVFVGQSSGWSNTQTLTIPNDDSTSSPSQNPTATPQQQNAQSGVLLGLNWEQIALIVLILIVAVLAFALVLSRRRSVKRIRALSNSSVV